MDKKTLVQILCVCGCGVVIFSALAVYMIIDRRDIDDVSVSDIVNSENVKINDTMIDDKNISEATSSKEDLPEPADDELVRVTDYIPDICVDLRYASENNFTGKKIYDFGEAYLRYGTVKKLRSAQTELKKHGFGLKIWDAFRPVKAQFKLWEICPNPKYVADPNKKYSSHSRGNTVDVTLVDASGADVEMPTGFDDFTELADRDYNDVKSKNAVKNVLMLENTMKECGFKPYSGEWWHFSDTDEYEVHKDFTL